MVLTSGADAWDAGSPDEVHALFSTVSRWLEPDGWGSRLPVLMNELYQGELPAEDVSRARIELAQARRELSLMSPAAVVWDIADPSRRPPDGDDVDPQITDLSQYFLNNDGRSLFDVLDIALARAEATHAPVTLRATDPASLPELGLRVGANVWGIGDRDRLRIAIEALVGRAQAGQTLRRLLEQLSERGLEGADLLQAQHEIAQLHGAGDDEAPESLRSQDGRDLLAIFDEALAYGARAGKLARIEAVL